jgi:NAD(P)-dependent dehydrogenase (short-subunit alcohol dehydrogenase family)
MVIFLTGGNGGIGSIIKEHLLNNNIDVLSPNSKNLDLSKNFNYSNLQVDGLIHCAGVNFPKTYNKVNIKEFNDLFKSNTFSFIELTQQLNFNKNSNIIAIGSLYATETKKHRLEYTMSKHALHGAVKTLAIEKSPEVLVNMVSPGFVDTPLTKQNLSSKEIKELDNKIPLGLTDAWSIADFLLYMIKHNKSITGQNIVMDGGYSLIGA